MERLSSADVAFLHQETRTTPQHVGGLAIFDPPASGFDYDRLLRLLEERISLAPRYRQRVRRVPGHLANPIWVDDPRFDITYHVRRSALPRPGTEAQLLEFCARIQSRLLDRGRPLWEMYLVDGLGGGRVAIVTKTHQAMVDEAGAVDLFEVILDAAPEPRRTVQALWMPQPEPGSLALVRDAARAMVLRPTTLVDSARVGLADARVELARASARAGGLGPAVRGVVSVGRSVLRRPPPSPLQIRLSEQRRLAISRTRLDDFRRVRAAYGGTVNDVVLAVITGALRGWLLSRAVPLRPATTVRALVPVSVVDDDEGTPRSSVEAAHPSRSGDPATRVRPLLVDLPVGEPDPVLRLTQLRYAMATHRASGRAVGADALTRLGGFAPPTLLALGARASSGLTRRMFSLVVTNVPGPQVSLYAAGARLREMFPILPISAGQALSIALTSYDGGVCFGINADRDGVRDADALARLIEESLQELLSGIPAVEDARSAGERRRRPPGRAVRGPRRERSSGPRPPRGRPTDPEDPA
ncbi:MAG: WS/DGAT/MGAT family O-acyltransferase [Jatrophihabitans sp.]|uniref:WS/DGAT/MGAT family O-acyltransferase n=1 Tax=Jatrophihabitans sp. TaxID=1932789 RepID=UPI003F7F32EE